YAGRACDTEVNMAERLYPPELVRCTSFGNTERVARVGDRVGKSPIILARRSGFVGRRRPAGAVPFHDLICRCPVLADVAELNGAIRDFGAGDRVVSYRDRILCRVAAQ